MLFNPDITKQAVEVVFSNKQKKHDFEPLSFNGIPVKVVNETKHIGMVLDKRLTFESHLDEKLAKARQGLGLMKQLKKWVSYNVLESIYKLYVRPHIEYGDIVYDISCLAKTYIFNFETANAISNKVEAIQYEAARIVSGAWKSTSKIKLYNNLGWESLNDRRTFRKLCLLYEILNNNFPRYLTKILDTQKYKTNSRLYNKLLMKNIPCRINRYKTYFFPSTINDWNKLEFDIKNSNSKNIFKKRLLNKIRPKGSPYFGIRDNTSIRYITMLRMELSPLRAHKHKHNFKDTTDPFCIVCGSLEDTKHYLLLCKSYQLSRVTLLQNVSNILKVNISTLPQRQMVSILLYGREDMNLECNHNILNEVINFIIKTKRLDTT